MNREEYAQTMFAEALKLLKIDKDAPITVRMYEYNGPIILLISNSPALPREEGLFIYLDLFGDTEEVLTKAYNTLMDYAEKRYEIIFGKGEK